jgi:hypothetical protein
VLGEYADRYRVLPKIHTVEGASYRAIHDRLWEIIFEEMEKRRPERQIEYAVPEPIYQAVREQSGETNSER